MKLILILFSLAYQANGSCDLEGPNQGEAGIGIILVPGAKISGDAYLPILRKIQEEYSSESMWIASTAAWFGDMPNPIDSVLRYLWMLSSLLQFKHDLEVGGQINTCLQLARDKGYDTSRVFFAGHSLGGIVMESYISGNPDIAQGIIMLGTWLPDLLRANNEFPVPVLTAIGELDGGGISYLRREWEETHDLSPEKQQLSKTIMVPQVNHGQVAAGEVPESVVENDIDAELSESDAHSNYAVRVADWLGLFLQHKDSTQYEKSVKNFLVYEAETLEFLEPFFAMRDAEETANYSPIVKNAQIEIINGEVDHPVTVTNQVLDAVTFEIYSPEAKKTQDEVHIKTYTHMMYDFDALDFNNHLSASTVKAKLKSADSIYDLVNKPTTGKFMECSVLNQKSYELALSVASRQAIERMNEKGRSLIFGADENIGWFGVPWEVSGSLKWEEQMIGPNGQVTLTSTHLHSDTGFFGYPGMHYCDILSPYRALEWIYIESVRNKMQF